MKIDHIHFYVADARRMSHWFVRTLSFQPVATGVNSHTCTSVVKNGAVCFVLSSPLTSASHVAQFLQWHPPGVADVAFRVQDVEVVMDRAAQAGAKVLQPIHKQQQADGYVKWGKIAAWGFLSHTLIEISGITEELLFPGLGQMDWVKSTVYDNTSEYCHTHNGVTYKSIDHVVLNVTAGDLERAVAWYENILGFSSQQAFAIRTQQSALYSKVMVHPDGYVKLPINEPASANSQIQEFLDVNQGPGIQHIALQTVDLVQAIAHLRQRDLPFLAVPPTYYTQLQQRPNFPLEAAELQEIAAQQILVDWEDETPQALLLQIFTHPIFGEPTFFLELIERRLQARGFGEGNFQALFEAIEGEQLKRGSLGIN